LKKVFYPVFIFLFPQGRQGFKTTGFPYIIMLLQCYIDPATGSKFFSKPEVYRYLKSMQSNGGSSQQREEGSSKRSLNNVCFHNVSASYNVWLS